MNRGDKTTLDKLEPGDRFYRADDAKKLVHELREKYSAYAIKYTCDISGKHLKFGVLMRFDTDVIFLRKNQTTKTN